MNKEQKPAPTEEPTYQVKANEPNDWMTVSKEIYDQRKSEGYAVRIKSQPEPKPAPSFTEGSEPENTVWWCDSCRRIGTIHCANPQECGSMIKIPFEQANKRWNELKASAPPKSESQEELWSEVGEIFAEPMDLKLSLRMVKDTVTSRLMKQFTITRKS